MGRAKPRRAAQRWREGGFGELAPPPPPGDFKLSKNRRREVSRRGDMGCPYGRLATASCHSGMGDFKIAAASPVRSPFGASSFGAGSRPDGASAAIGVSVADVAAGLRRERGPYSSGKESLRKAMEARQLPLSDARRSTEGFRGAALHLVCWTDAILDDGVLELRAVFAAIWFVHTQGGWTLFLGNRDEPRFPPSSSDLNRASPDLRRSTAFFEDAAGGERRSATWILRETPPLPEIIRLQSFIRRF